MNYIKYIGLLLFICFMTDAQAQIMVERTDVVYLKNGSVFRGTIENYVQGEQLRLRINEASTIVIKDDEIKKIVQVDYQKNKKVKAEKEYAFKERGLYHVTSLHFTGGTEAFGPDPVLDFGGHHITGFQFNRLLGVGLGIGMDYYYVGSGQKIMPIYAEARGYVRAERLTPMYSLAAGYGFTFENNERNITEAKGGIMFYPAVGFRTGGSANANYFFDFGVKIQQATFTYQTWDIRVNKMTYNRFVLRTGILF